VSLSRQAVRQPAVMAIINIKDNRRKVLSFGFLVLSSLTMAHFHQDL